MTGIKRQATKLGNSVKRKLTSFGESVSDRGSAALAALNNNPGRVSFGTWCVLTAGIALATAFTLTDKMFGKQIPAVKDFLGGSVITVIAATVASLFVGIALLANLWRITDKQTQNNINFNSDQFHQAVTKALGYTINTQENGPYNGSHDGTQQYEIVISTNHKENDSGMSSHDSPSTVTLQASIPASVVKRSSLSHT